MSEKLEAFEARYVAVHSEGNPQLRLTKFTKPTLATCFCCEGHFPNLIKVTFISGLIARVCSKCLEEYQRRKTVKKIVGA